MVGEEDAGFRRVRSVREINEEGKANVTEIAAVYRQDSSAPPQKLLLRRPKFQSALQAGLHIDSNSKIFHLAQDVARISKLFVPLFVARQQAVALPPIVREKGKQCFLHFVVHFVEARFTKQDLERLCWREALGEYLGNEETVSWDYLKRNRNRPSLRATSEVLGRPISSPSRGVAVESQRVG